MSSINELSGYNPDGTRLGQDADDKCSFYGATPCDQPAHIDDATDAGTALTQIAAILDALEELGLVASS